MLLGDFPNALVIAVVAALWRVASHEVPVQPVLTVTVVTPFTIFVANAVSDDVEGDTGTKLSRFWLQALYCEERLTGSFPPGTKEPKTEFANANSLKLGTCSPAFLEKSWMMTAKTVLVPVL
jgi:hypothetical protein